MNKSLLVLHKEIEPVCSAFSNVRGSRVNSANVVRSEGPYFSIAGQVGSVSVQSGPKNRDSVVHHEGENSAQILIDLAIADIQTRNPPVVHLSHGWMCA